MLLRGAQWSTRGAWPPPMRLRLSPVCSFCWHGCRRAGDVPFVVGLRGWRTPSLLLNSLPAQGGKRCAPSAMRNPLSPVRRGVSNAMTPIEPDRRERRAQRGEPPEQQSAEPESRALDRGVLGSQRRPPGANFGWSRGGSEAPGATKPAATSMRTGTSTTREYQRDHAQRYADGIARPVSKPPPPPSPPRLRRVK